MATEMKLYESNDALIQLDVLVENETVWLTQAQMTTLFQRDVSVVSRHIHNIFKEGELSMDSNLHFLQIANSDRPVAFYSLDVIISVGYRVKSRRGTEFRIWATNVLKEYIYRGYAISQRQSTLHFWSIIQGFGQKTFLFYSDGKSSRGCGCAPAYGMILPSLM